MVEILFQSEHTEDSGKHTKAGREIASLEPRQGVSRYTNPRSQLGEVRNQLTFDDSDREWQAL